jgi:hypothetical protein
LTEKNWFDAVKNTKQLDTDEDFRRAFSEVRNIAKNEFGNLLRNALRSYTEANGGQLPTDLSQLKPLFEKPVDDSVFNAISSCKQGSSQQCARGEFWSPKPPHCSMKTMTPATSFRSMGMLAEREPIRKTSSKQRYEVRRSNNGLFAD